MFAPLGDEVRISGVLTPFRPIECLVCVYPNYIRGHVQRIKSALLWSPSEPLSSHLKVKSSLTNSVNFRAKKKRGQTLVDELRQLLSYRDDLKLFRSEWLRSWPVREIRLPTIVVSMTLGLLSISLVPGQHSQAP